MSLPRDDHFAHRTNRDGTTDSICRYCFATVSTSTWETELAQAERGHVCDPTVVSRLKKAAGREGADEADPRHRTGSTGQTS